MDTKKQHTLKDIAELAGVSRATVDRVLKGKGPVSKETHDKIQSILAKIDYRPNVIAQTLKKGSLNKIAVLMPDHEFDKFWERATRGINSAINEFSYIGIQVHMHLFNPYKKASFQLHANQVLKEGYDGVLVAPLFYNESIQFFDQCKEKGLSVVTFNTHIEEGMKLCHVGQDLIKSGEVAASLLFKLLGKDKDYLIVHIDEDISNAKHMQEKEIGFRKFLSEKSIESKSIHVLNFETPTFIEKEITKVLEEYPTIEGIFVTTSKAHYVADVLEAYSLQVKLVGYDLMENNIEHLEKNNIDFLIYQNPIVQASQGITILVDYLTFKKEVASQKLLPIEIIIKENIQNYLS